MSSRRGRRRGTPPWLYGLLGAVVAGAAAIARRRYGSGAGGSGAQATSTPSAPPTTRVPAYPSASAGAPDATPAPEPGEEPLGEPWQCECGKEFMVAGRDRHRVYWPADASPSDPILSGTCPNCDRPLPSDSGLATA